MSDVLALLGIAKRFGTVAALVDASLTVAPGQIVALLGENGAGKTTLMRVAFGMVQPDAGEVRIAGHAVRLASPAHALGLGIGMVHQHFALVPALTAAESIALGGRGWFSARRTAEHMRAVAERAGLSIDPAATVGSLSASAQQRLEIVKALARGVRCLILDEPTAVLTPQESAELLRFLREFAAGGGAAVLITHKLREALGVADVVTVLRRGRTVLRLPRAEASESIVADAMLGESASVRARQEVLGVQQARAARSDAPVVASATEAVVHDIRGVPALRGVSLVMRAGEIVGVTGVDGSGVHELVRLFAGRTKPLSGTVTLPERIGFIPEDRLRDALVPEWTIVENIALKSAGSAHGRIQWDGFERDATRLMERYDVRGDGPRAPVASLSGGNQQKLVLARELDGDPALLVVEQPTRGLDIAASAAIHERLIEARDRGAAVLVASADLDELLMLADRVIVAFDGAIREVERDAQAVGRAMLGLAEESAVARS